MLVLGGCGAGWRRFELLPLASLGARQQVQLWASGQVLQLHGVIVGADSLSGIPFFKPLDCDSCRVSIRLGAVDSLRVGNSMDGFWKTAALGAVAALAVLCRLGWCEAGGT